MFSDYEKILVNLENDSDILEVLSNINKNAVILYDNNNNPKITKYLFRKGIENINFIGDNICNNTIIKIGKPDLFISNKGLDVPNIQLCDKNNITFFNYTSKDSTCGKCKKESNYLGISKIDKICSESCALLEHPGFYEIITNYKESLDPSKGHELEKSFSNPKQEIGKFKDTDLTEAVKKKQDKFQRIILIEAKRNMYRAKKEEYIKNMRSNSNIKINYDEEPQSVPQSLSQIKVKMCKATTKKEGKSCGNKALVNSEYCGIVSHRKMDPNYTVVKKTSTNKNFKNLTKGCRFK